MDLNVELGDEVIERVRAIAMRHYGDSEDASLSRVVESALEMRLLSIRLIDRGGHEIEEPMARWEFVSEQSAGHLSAEIQRWLFRKGGS